MFLVSDEKVGSWALEILLLGGAEAPLPIGGTE